MKAKTLILTLTLLLLAACQPAANGVFEAGQATLHPGQSLDDVQSGSVLTFVEVVQDSRCPADAICVTSGFVQVLLEVQQGDITRQEVVTLGDMAEGDVNSIVVGEFTVTLVEVNPYPLASQPTEPADYSVTLDIQN
jgi:hypothetical protein